MHGRFFESYFLRFARPRFRPDLRQNAFLKHDLEGDGSGNRYAEFEVLIGQLLDLVGDFDVLEALVTVRLSLQTAQAQMLPSASSVCASI